MTWMMRGSAWSCALWLLAACAQGYQGPEGWETPTGQGSGSAGMMGSAGSSAGAPGGEPCTMGQSQPCACAGGGRGTRLCRYDSSSPTQGSFSACDQCSPPVAGGSGDIDGTSGRGGAGGSAGSSGTGGSSGSSFAGAGGTGGSSFAGAGGTGGSTPPMMQEEAWCVFVPFPLPGLCN